MPNLKKIIFPKNFFFKSKNKFLNGIGVMLYGMPIPFCSFKNIFEKRVTPENITESRTKRYEYPTEWMKRESIPYSMDNLTIKNECHRLSISKNNIEYEFLFMPKKSNKLYVCFNGRRDTSVIKYPVFTRWKYNNILNGNILCVEDPMYKGLASGTATRWYYGTKNTSYLIELADIICAVLKKLRLKKQDITFIGSSAGGTAAMFMANLMDTTSCIAMNPQIVLNNFSKESDLFFKNMGVDLTSEDIFNRNVIKTMNKKSYFMYVVNSASQNDYKKHFLPYCYSHKVTPRYGISQHKNIITWVHNTNGKNLHASNPEDGLPFAIFALEQCKKGKDVNELNSMSFLMNEMINKIYITQKLLHEKQNVHK